MEQNSKQSESAAPVGSSAWLGSEPAKVDTKLTTGEDLPKQLEIRGGRLVMRESGKTPTFDIADGTIVNLLPRAEAVRMLDNSIMIQSLGA
jgi:hypothetical protein